MRLGRLFILAVISAVILNVIENSFWWIATVMVIGGILVFLGEVWMSLSKERED